MCMGTAACPPVFPRLELGQAGILLGHLKGEAAHHGLLCVAHKVERLLLLDGHRLLVAGVDDLAELCQGLLGCGKAGRVQAGRSDRCGCEGVPRS